jgi:hypothetical protein
MQNPIIKISNSCLKANLIFVSFLEAYIVQIQKLWDSISSNSVSNVYPEHN